MSDPAVFETQQYNAAASARARWLELPATYEPAESALCRCGKPYRDHIEDDVRVTLEDIEEGDRAACPDFEEVEIEDERDPREDLDESEE